jgi:hypothetical protein
MRQISSRVVLKVNEPLMPGAEPLAETNRIHAAMCANLDARRPLSTRRSAILRSMRGARKAETWDRLNAEFDALGDRLEELGAEFDGLAGQLHAEGKRLVAIARAALAPYSQEEPRL